MTLPTTGYGKHDSGSCAYPSYESEVRIRPKADMS